MSTSELDSRNITLSMRKSVENLVISSQDAIGQSISQALTFSGVITQRSNQTLHENRSVSRSPSPSLRHAESATDVLEYDKDVIEAGLLQGSELSLLPSLAGGDSASISSGEQITVVNVASSKDAKIANSARGVDGARIKKKSWYNSLYPTYKSKSDDFKRLFKDLPEDERLIVDYSCALQKDILVHGRLYASQHYLCFHASIFGWETTLSLRWKEVTAITKEKTALVIPNAILVCTESEKNFLTSFTGRDKVYLMLFRIWQNALMDQPMTSQEIWAWVHTYYGEELGFNSDDEGYARDLPDDSTVLPDSVSEDLVDSSSLEASGGAGENREDPRVNRSTSHGRDSSPPIVTNGDAEYREEEAGDTLPTDMSDTSDSEPDKPHNGCDVEKCSEAHDSKLLLRQQFPFNIDQMFTMIFTNSKFNLELLAARGTTDYVQAPWQPQGGLKCRQISYTLGLTSGPIGPKEVQVTETQVMNKCSKPGVLYSINSTSENAGIPYADYFSVQVHYCLLRVSETATDLQLYGHVRYKKSMWPMVRAFLEKNTMSGLEEFGRLLDARLRAEAEGGAPSGAARKARRHRRLAASSAETATVAAVKSPVLAAAAPRASLARPRAGAPPAARARARARAACWLAAALLLLLAVNGFLCWRLYTADRQSYGLDIEELQNKMSSMSGWAMSEWSRLLEAHTARQRGQLRAWRHALDHTVAHLAQTEQALAKLLETIKPSLEKAQEEAEQHRDEL